MTFYILDEISNEQMNKKFTIYIFSKHMGGEYIWFARIAPIIKAEIKFIWKEDGSGPNLPPSGICNFFIYYLTKILAKYSPELAKSLYSLIGTYTYKIKKMNDEVILVSSTYVPIPRGAAIVAYIHTPSRLLTIGLKEEKERRAIKFSSRIYFLIWKNIYYLLYKRSLNRVKLVLTNSENTKKRLREFMKIDSSVVYPSVDTANFYTEESDSFFFYPSRISPQKRQFIALRAFEEFNKQIKGFKLIFATTTLKSKENIAYMNSIKKYAIEKQIPIEIKEGLERGDLIRIYAKAFACIFTGINEDFGQIPIESQAASKPILAINEGGMKETIKDGLTGFLVKDERELTEKMMLLAKSPELAKEMGKEGRLNVVNNYDDATFVKNLSIILKSENCI